jgi:hypothetical protein
MCSLEDQDPGDELREIPGKMEGGGKPAGPTTDDENIKFVHRML